MVKSNYVIMHEAEQESFILETTRNNKVFIKSEILKKEQLDDGSFIIEGLALPYDKFSRNGVKYRKQSIEQMYQTFIGRPCLFNHNFDISIGHIEMTDLREEGMGYRINLDGQDPFVANLVRKIKRGDITSVSVQVMYANETYDVNTGLCEVDITDGIEISVVTIPGFADTTARVAESFNSSNLKIKKGGKEMADPEQDPKNDTQTETDPEEEPKEKDDPMKELKESLKSMGDGQNEIKELCKQILEACKTKKSSDDNTDDPDDADPKDTEESLKSTKVNKEGLEKRQSSVTLSEGSKNTEEKIIDNDKLKEAFKK